MTDELPSIYAPANPHEYEGLTPGANTPWEAWQAGFQAAIDWLRKTPEDLPSTVGGIVYGRVARGWRAITDGEYYRLNGFSRLVSDLDRSEHGRHEGDAESQTPGGVSLGNPMIQPGQHIGYTLSGERIVMPVDRKLRHDPDAWLPF